MIEQSSVLGSETVNEVGGSIIRPFTRSRAPSLQRGSRVVVKHREEVFQVHPLNSVVHG
jgi:hypothetical protein